MSIFSKLFSGGAKGVVDSISGVVDKFISTPDEKAAIKLALEQELNRHMEAMDAQATKLLEAELADRASARSRETEFVKTTGHIDWMQTIVGTLILIAFIGSLLMIGFKKLPEGSEHLMINAIGILEVLVGMVVGYYYGTSAGSRIKDMRSNK